MDTVISASMLAADFNNLGRDIDLINRSECDWFHLDIMDGVFVPNISYGFPVIKCMAKETKKPLDAHLMIVDPDRYIGKFAELGVEYQSVHYEACNHLHRTVQNIHSFGMKAGVAINPHTSVMLLEDIICDCDFVLLMSVNPGFGGQSFIKHSVEKTARLKRLIDDAGANCFIEVDGGVSSDNIRSLIDAGATAFVAGSAVFKSEDPSKTISLMKKA